MSTDVVAILSEDALTLLTVTEISSAVELTPVPTLKVKLVLLVPLRANVPAALAASTSNDMSRTMSILSVVVALVRVTTALLLMMEPS